MDEIDEIGQGPDRPGWEFRLPKGPRRWLALSGIACLVAAAGVYGANRLGGQHVKPAGSPFPATASPAAGPIASVGSQMIEVSPQFPVTNPSYPNPKMVIVQLQPQSGLSTVLLTCDSVVWKRLPGWQAGSLRAGPLWLVGAHQDGYASLGRSRHAPNWVPTEGAPMRVVELYVHVDAGAAVDMTAPAGAMPYFEFLNSPASTGDFQGPDIGRGYTFVPCSAGNHGHPGMTAFYQVGFSILPGDAVNVEVQRGPSGRPVWLTLRAPNGKG